MPVAGNGSGGAAGENTGGTAGGGEASGGHGGEGETGGAGAGGAGAGGTGIAGTGNRGGAAGSAGADGGQGNAPTGAPGIVCGPWDNALPDVNCAAGEVCALCEEDDTNRTTRCAPNPAIDPEEYETFSATCTNGILVTGCDGPEDCPDGTTCQIRSDDDYLYGACSAEPPACVAYCIACNSNQDCSENDRCVPNALGGGDWSGATCGPGLEELLLDGDWIVGWSGGAEHYSWFRFTKDDLNPLKGTVRTSAIACVGCMSFGCEDGEGTYEVVAENQIRLEFSDSCMFSYRFTNLSSPAAPGSGAQALVSAQVTVDDAAFASARMQLYPPGVGCNLDFSSCLFPPP